MEYCYIQEAKIPVFINSSPIEEVPDFRSIGSTLVLNCKAKDEITTRITIARNAFFRNLYGDVAELL